MIRVHRRSSAAYFSVAIATLLLSALSLIAQTPTARAGFGVIKGRVVNENNQPLANAVVDIARFDSKRANQSVATDREGKFEITGLEPVPYRMSARLAAYTPLLQDADGEEIRHRPGDTVTLVLVKGGAITGTVTTQNGEPIVGIRVRARMTRDSAQPPWPYNILSLERSTDDRGVYRIYGLPTGTYLVSTGGAGERSWRVDPFDVDAPTFAPSSTRDTAEEYSVHAGEEVNNVDIRYRNEPGRTISGKAIAPNTAEKRGFGIRLSLVKEGNSLGFTTGQEPGKGFMFRGLADGEYDIIAFSVNANNDYMWSEGKRIKVNGADVTGIELLTLPLSAVSGKVVLQESKATECTDKQRPIFSETLVSARSKASLRQIQVPYWVSGSPVNADTEGNLSLKNLLSGQYYLDAQFRGKSWYLDSITLPAGSVKAASPAKPVDAAKNWTTLKSGARLSGLTITLAHGAASVKGEVALQENETLSVYLVPAERERADDVLRFFTTVVNDAGKVEMNNLAPGRYWVLVTSEEVSLNKLRLPDATEFRTRLRREAEAAKSELELKPCQNLKDFRPQITQRAQM